MPVTSDTSFVDRLAPNVAVQFLDRVAKTPDAEAYRFPRGDQWESVTWQEAGDRVRRLAAGLLSLGIEPEQRVGIVSNTRYEWILADLAVMCAAGATTTVYPSTNAEDTAYILSDSECRVVFAEDYDQIAKVTLHKNELPQRDEGRDLRRRRRLRLGAQPRRPRRARRRLPRRAPRRHRPDREVDRARRARHADLHVRHHRAAQGRAPAPPVLGLRGRGHRGPGHPERGRPAVPVAADGPLVRQGPAVHPARLRVRRPPSTAGSRRSSTTSVS